MTNSVRLGKGGKGGGVEGMRRKVKERERIWECRDRAGEVQELTRSQWQEAMGL
jgi:hypothetical protein